MCDDSFIANEISNKKMLDRDAVLDKILNMNVKNEFFAYSVEMLHQTRKCLTQDHDNAM
jgi:hypothetical protein